ncbi:MAG: MBL fold metallo-hydrolase [Actinomycetota bacterium]|nr:MBL fold metallo-hydrolase [Actinomycetota bacterium]
MRLTVLGCSGSGPGPRSPASGYLVQAGNTAIVLDLGNGTFGPLQRYIDPFNLNAVLLSHLHADHCADVTALINYRRYHPRPPSDASSRRPLILASEGAFERLAGLHAPSAAARSDADFSDVLELQVIEDGSIVHFGSVRVTVSQLDHPGGSFGFRLESGGRTLVFTGDTGPTDRLIELSHNADVLLCEASWPHSAEKKSPVTMHLTGLQAGEYAAAAKVGKLLLTHVLMWFDEDALLSEARETFNGIVHLAQAGQQFEI